MKKVALDPGHGGTKGPGVVVNSIREADVVLEIANRVGHYIRKLSDGRLTTFQTRTLAGKYVSINNRVIDARSAGCDVFVSIHLNAPGPNTKNREKVSGSEVYVSAVGLHRAASVNLGQTILDRLDKVGLKSRGVKWDTQSGPGKLGVLRGFSARGPAVLVEVGYLTNPHDRALVTNKHSREVIAIAIAAAVVEFCTGEKPDLSKA